MAMANINIRTDEDIKARCESLFESLGMGTVMINGNAYWSYGLSVDRIKTALSK